MSQERESRRAIVDRFLSTLGGSSATQDQLHQSRERTRQLVEAEWNRRAEDRASGTAPAPSRRKLWLTLPVTAAVAVSLVVFAAFLLRVEPTKVATVDKKETSAGLITLLDGSTIEKEPGTSLQIDQTGPAARIELERGAILVKAAPQRAGALVVQTRDCRVSVVGTVFAVRAEASGTRVSVFEGKVAVEQAGETKHLVAGEQLVTNPGMSRVPLQEEIEWSREASQLAALLSPPAESRVAIAPQVQTTNSGPSSIEGRVFIRGTNQPLSGVDLELARVEGSTTAPLAPGVAEMFALVLNTDGAGWSNTWGATPPALLAPEVKYAKSSEDGVFKFDQLKDGKYRLAAVRNGGEYYPAEFGQRDLQQRGLYFPVSAGQALKDLKIEMTPTGAITGRVVDEDGLPLGHLTVLALVPQYRGSEQRFFIDRQAVTDENGVYRLYWLGPGKYYVAAVYEDPRRRQTVMAPTAPPGRTLARSRATSPVVTHQLLQDGTVLEEAYGVVYFGGSTDPVAAAAIEVRSGETFAGADIPMGAGRMQTGHIRGTIIDGETGKPARAFVLAASRQWRPNGLVLAGNTNAEGVFDLAGAFPENYILTAITATEPPLGPGGTNALGNATGPTPNQPRPQVGYMSVETDGRQAVDVRIVTTPGITVSGRVQIEGNSSIDASAALARININLTRDPDILGMAEPFMPLPPVPAGSPPPRNGQVTSTGDFKMLVAPGDFRMTVANIPPSTYVKSIRMGNEDILRSGLHITKSVDTMVQIVIGTDGGTLKGSVIDASARPFTNATVALVPEGVALRGQPELYRNTTSDSSGNFELKAIPPGSYKLFAWEWAPQDSWQNPDFIRNYEGQGKLIRIAPFEKQQQVQINVISKAR
jgi:FecR protein/Carboxypeptidase regulatory-like domain